MDGKGRSLDNVYIERFWRTIKYDEVYLKDYENMEEAKRMIGSSSASTMRKDLMPCLTGGHRLCFMI